MEYVNNFNGELYGEPDKDLMIEVNDYSNSRPNFAFEDSSLDEKILKKIKEDKKNIDNFLNSGSLKDNTSLDMYFNLIYNQADKKNLAYLGRNFSAVNHILSDIIDSEEKFPVSKREEIIQKYGLSPINDLVSSMFYHKPGHLSECFINSK